MISNKEKTLRVKLNMFRITLAFMIVLIPCSFLLQYIVYTSEMTGKITRIGLIFLIGTCMPMICIKDIYTKMKLQRKFVEMHLE